MDDENKSVASASRSTTLRFLKPDIRQKFARLVQNLNRNFAADGVDGRGDGVICHKVPLQPSSLRISAMCNVDVQLMCWRLEARDDERLNTW
jgi:hypothetical protein